MRLAALKQYHWPGNVRELRNLVERVLILNPKTQRIERKHLPMLVYRGPGQADGVGPDQYARRRVFELAGGA